MNENDYNHYINSLTKYKLLNVPIIQILKNRST